MTGPHTRRDRLPIAATLAAAVGALVLAAPLVGLLWRAPWTAIGSILGDGGVRTALRVSLMASLGATAVALVLGLPLAWVLARHRFAGRRLLRSLALVPLVLPPVVGGVALLLAFGRRGVLGQFLDDWLGVQLPFTLAGAIVAQAFVALPFVVLTAEAAFGNLDRRYEDVATTLGAGRWLRFRRVVLPLTAPALVSGAVLAWARALGEFGATITFAGNTPGQTSTVPLQVFVLLESGAVESAVVLSLILLAVSITVLVALRDRWTPAL